MDNTKKCNCCGLNKDFSLFGKHQGVKGNKDGLQPWCKECKNKKARDAKKTQKQKSPKFLMDWRMSKNISRCLKNVKRGRSWKDLVGYTPEELVAHLEKLFQPGMSWENYGTVWHIDHIIPKKYFIYNDADESFRKCWSLNNLQPLFAQDNLKKNCRLPEDIINPLLFHKKS